MKSLLFFTMFFVASCGVEPLAVASEGGDSKSKSIEQSIKPLVVASNRGDSGDLEERVAALEARLSAVETFLQKMSADLLKFVKSATRYITKMPHFIGCLFGAGNVAPKMGDEALKNVMYLCDSESDKYADKLLIEEGVE